MSFSSTLPGFPLKLNLYNLVHLEKTLGYSVKKIRGFLDQKDKHVFEKTIIKERNGKIKERIVYNTSLYFKSLLRALNKKILHKAVLPNGVFGGVTGKSIDDMAKYHCGKEALFSIDLKDFFPNIKSGMVFRMFQQSGCSKEISGLLTDLVTYNNFLPQGFPTSTMIANIIAYNLDIAHFHISKKYNLTRTRWIDDIVFSGRIFDIKAATSSIVGAVNKSGFVLNKDKLQYQNRKSKPIVTGLCVNRNQPHADTQIIALDMLISRCENVGIPTVQNSFDSDCIGKTRNLEASIYGRISFISKYDPEIAESFKTRFDSISQT